MHPQRAEARRGLAGRGEGSAQRVEGHGGNFEVGGGEAGIGPRSALFSSYEMDCVELFSCGTGNLRARTAW